MTAITPISRRSLWIALVLAAVAYLGRPDTAAPAHEHAVLAQPARLPEPAEPTPRLEPAPQVEPAPRVERGPRLGCRYPIRHLDQGLD